MALKLSITACTLFLSIQIFGQANSFLKTTNKKNLHYLELRRDSTVVYKMGNYYDKAGTGPAILSADTLVLTKQDEYKGRYFALQKGDGILTLISGNGRKYQTEPESEWKVNTALNNAYCLKSYFELSDKLNKEFPLNHYTFRNGYYAWEKHLNKAINHKEFVKQTERGIEMIYDSISRLQIAFTNTSNFIIANAEHEDYSVLKDSISTLPIDYRPQSGYFDKSVYQMAKANPEYFYKLLQDFPSSKMFIYFAVDQDKELVRQLKKVQGYDDLKTEFLKDYNFGKTMNYKMISMYAVVGGLLTWLIVAQP